MSTQIIIPILASAVCGLLIGYAIRALLARWQALAMERQAAAKLQEADEESGRRLREADIKARSEIVKARSANARPRFRNTMTALPPARPTSSAKCM